MRTWVATRPPPQATEPARPSASELLQRAHMMAHDEATAGASSDGSDLSPQELREALQSLRVHQIEL